MAPIQSKSSLDKAKKSKNFSSLKVSTRINQLAKNLNLIVSEALESDQLAIALKALENLLKLNQICIDFSHLDQRERSNKKGLRNKEVPSSSGPKHFSEPLQYWSDSDIMEMIKILEQKINQ